jgi:(R,R)-butanediol dehydrogenase / meso-butanediol dehydrogenase / diacetyl reductase
VRIESVPDPGDPGQGEVVLQVQRAGICGTDAAEYVHGPHLVPLYERHPGSGRLGPVVLGHEFVGRVVAAGRGTDPFPEGLRVVSGAGVSCGNCEWCAAGRTNLCRRYYTLGLQADGGLANYVVVPAVTLHPVPAECGDDAAAIAQPLAVALHTARRADIGAGESVAVIGVGGIGAFIVTVAARRGARPLIAVDVDERRLETARALGATETIAARRSDPARAMRELTGGDGADTVIEASGAPGAFETALASVRRGGRLVLVGLPADAPRVDVATMTLREVEATTSVAHVCDVDLPEALELLATTELSARVIDRVIGLDDLVEGGLEMLARGTALGKILVDPSE